MNDVEFVAELRRVFDANDPSDGIDRSDGYGEDYRFGDLRVVTAADGFDDLDVTVAVGGRQVTARLLFDREWRTESGLDDVGAYAAYVVAKWSSAVVGESDASGTPSSGVVVDDLEAALRQAWGNATRVGAGVVEVVSDDGQHVHVHATDDEWCAFVGRAGLSAYDELDEMIRARWDDEHHVVFFRGQFHRSVRAELPPVRSLLDLESGDD